MNNHKPIIALLAVMSLATGTFITGSAYAAQSKGGKDTGHMSSNGRTKTQWSADPEKGWVRTDKRRKPPDEGAENSKSNREKHKDKPSGKKGRP